MNMFETSSFLKNVVIVGAGRVGISLFQDAKNSGLNICAILSHKSPRFIEKVKIETESINNWEPKQKIGCLIIAVPDRNINKCAKILSGKFKNISGYNWVAFHTSGSLDHSVLSPLAKCGISTASWHPLQTFPSPVEGRFKSIPTAIEGNSAAVKTAEQLAYKLGAHPFTIEPQLKPLYHALSVISCSHVGAMLLICQEGVKYFPEPIRKQLWEGWISLAKETIKNFENTENNLISCITGPVTRNDTDTINSHVEKLSKFSPHASIIYKNISEYLSEIIKRGTHK